MQRERQIERLKNYITDFPDLEIWIISLNNECSKLYWARINTYLCTEKKPVIISKGNYYKDGYNAHNAVILLCGQWYKNEIAFSDIFKMQLKEARFSLPIDEFPEPLELQKDEMNYISALEEQIKSLQDIQKTVYAHCTKGMNVIEHAGKACEIARTIEYLSTSISGMQGLKGR